MTEKKEKTIESAKRLAILIVSVMLLATSVICQMLNWNSFYNGEHVFMFGLLLLFAYFWAIATWLIDGRPFISVYMAFLLYLLICNAGQTILYYFNGLDVNLINVYTTLPKGYLLKMLAFQTSCVYALSIGALLGGKKYKNKTIETSKLTKESKTTNERSLLFNIAYYVVLAIVLVSTAIQFRYRSVYTYAEYYYSDVIRTSNALTFIYCILSYRFFFDNCSKKIARFGFFGINLLVIVMSMIVGNRGEMLPLIAMLLFIHRHFYPQFYKKRYIPIYMIVAFVLLSLIGMISSTRTQTVASTSFSQYFDKGLFYYIKQLLYESGQAAFPTELTIKYIDYGHPVQETILYNIVLTIIPRPILLLFVTEPISVGIETIAPAYFDPNTGMGFSYFADLYYNFAGFGFICAFVWGFIITKMETVAYLKLSQGKKLFACVILGLLGSMIYYARAQIDTFLIYFRISVYIVIVYFIVSRFKKKKIT